MQNIDLSELSTRIYQSLLQAEVITISIHLVLALVVGGVIGLERSYHGRPAGFRTHALVCLASSLLMTVTFYQSRWLPEAMSIDAVRTDPTRMAQGIMTGIGFLGAGVIFKEGLSIRGLTTSASIWITAAIGILLGVGFYYPAFLATGLTLITLSMFRWFEDKLLPAHHYANLTLSFTRGEHLDEPTLFELLRRHHLAWFKFSYRLTDSGQNLQYGMVIRAIGPKHFAQLSKELVDMPQIKAFNLTPNGD